MWLIDLGIPYLFNYLASIHFHSHTPLHSTLLLSQPDIICHLICNGWSPPKKPAWPDLTWPDLTPFDQLPICSRTVQLRTLQNRGKPPFSLFFSIDARWCQGTISTRFKLDSRMGSFPILNSYPRPMYVWCTLYATTYIHTYTLIMYISIDCPSPKRNPTDGGRRHIGT